MQWNYPGKPPRFHQSKAPYFLTFCTFKRRPLLHLDNMPELLIEELAFYSRKHLEALIAYTILPDHIHLMVEVGDEIKSLSYFLRDFKKFTAVQIMKRLRSGGSSDPLIDKPHDCHRSRSNDRPLRLLSRVWQPGTMDHCIRISLDNTKDYQNHLAYLFFNSMKHLQIPPKDYPYHNFRGVVEHGILDESFHAVPEEIASKFVLYE